MSEFTHLDSQGLPRMVDVSGKPETLREAQAEAVLWVGHEIVNAIRDGRTPKGNIFETARIAGVMGAKRTCDLIPLCHQLNLTHASVDMKLLEDRIVIRACTRTRGSTGVEMEALTAASIAGLTLYDMLKALSKEMHMEGVRVVAKSGGRSGDYPKKNAQDFIRAAVVTISDRCASGITHDTAGPAVAALLNQALGARIVRTCIVPDEASQISAVLIEICEAHIDLLLTVGGTGISPRDVTPEATRTVIDRELPGLAEAMRSASALLTPNALISRAIAGIRGSTLILNLPGSLKGATENLSAVLPALPHALSILRNEAAHTENDEGRLISSASAPGLAVEQNPSENTQ
jgi:cyclic pyranopterin phosphate synthase